MIKVECDRCGTQKQTERAAVKVAVGLLSRVEIPIPEEWRRVDLPAEKPGAQPERVELCSRCVNALRQFMTGDGAVPGLLEPESLAAADAEAGPQCGNCGHPEHTDGVCVAAVIGDQGAGRCMCTEELAELGDENARRVLGLTERAQKLASGSLRVSEAREVVADVKAAERPDSSFLECPEADPANRACGGFYPRGRLTEHMQAAHGGGGGTRPCALGCGERVPNPTMGQHIAKAHPGEYEKWRSDGQPGQ
jgi:hypothetical protein